VLEAPNTRRERAHHLGVGAVAQLFDHRALLRAQAERPDLHFAQHAEGQRQHHAPEREHLALALGVLELDLDAVAHLDR
jgi:hypothetical protein